MTFLMGWWKEILIGVLVVMVLFQRERLNTKDAQLDTWDVRAEAQQKDFDRREKANERNKERTDAEFKVAVARAVAIKLRVKPGAAITSSKETFTPGSPTSTSCINGRELYIGLGEVARRHADRASDFSAESAKRAGERFEPLARQVEQLAAAFRACQAWAREVE